MLRSQASTSCYTYFMLALLLHLLLFFLFTIGSQITGKKFVFENTQTPDIIQANIIPLSDSIPPSQPTPQSTSLPSTKTTPPPSVIPVEKSRLLPIKKEAIALHHKNPIKQEKQKTKQQEQIEQQLLADLKKTKIQENTVKQQHALENAFASEMKNLAKKKPSRAHSASNTLEQTQHAQGEVDKYKAMVLQAIGQHWLIPNDADKTLATKLLIYLAPGGVVLDAEIYQSSGNPALDNSARAAVFKASPLPVPTEPATFNFFRRFVLVFRPMYFQQNGQFELQSKTDA